MENHKVIVALPKSEFRDELLLQFQYAGIEAKTATDEDQILYQIKLQPQAVLLTQMNLRRLDAIELILELKDMRLDLPVVILDRNSERLRKAASKLHFAAFLEWPCNTWQVVKTVANVLKSS